MYKLTHEELIRYFSDFGYQWLEYLNDDNRYKGVFTKVLLKCPNGHYYKTTYNKFKRGMRCGQCYGNKKFSNDVVNEVITSRGFKLLSNYKNMRTKLKLQCPKGHIFYTNFNYFKRTKYGCSECIKGRNFSDKEREIQRYVSKLVKGVVWNDRTQITNPLANYKLELDVWIPDLNKAIEFNGKYYHTNDKVKTRDKIKKEECLKKGIDLLVVNEKDYMKDKEKVLETVKNFIGGY